MRRFGALLVFALVACSGLTKSADLASSEDAGEHADASSFDSSLSDAPPEWDGQRSPCSTGPAYGLEHSFGYESKNEDPSTPRCLARCDYVALPRAVVSPADFTTDGLPNGSCAHESEICQAGAWDTCPCPDHFGALSIYECTCVSGQWSCVITSQGGGICSCPRDAGHD